jgi:hypothetical protein
MDINLRKLDHTFSQKPLLVGGKAMEHYGLRKAGNDIDFIVPEQDVVALIKKYPDRVKDLWGDLGVCPFEFEIWKTICLFGYDDLKENALDAGEFLIISLDKLLFMKTLGIKKEKYLKDAELIIEHILNEKYKAFHDTKEHNKTLLAELAKITYIEKTGPQA